jgi:spore coat protein H
MNLRLPAIGLVFLGWIFCAHGGDADDLFSGTAARPISILLDRAAVEGLRAAPREYVTGTIKEGDSVWTNVAIHLKGATGSFRPIDDKPGFTLSFDRFSPKQRFHGLTKIHLNNSVEDGSYANELLGSELFRAAGIPAPRIGHAVVTLNRKRLGVYVLKEGFTEDFVARELRMRGRFYEPGADHDVDEALDEKWNSAGASSPSLAALTAAARETNLEQRWTALQQTLDVNAFATFMAMEVLLGHRDGYVLAQNNFRILAPESGRAVFLPSGMDQLFGRAPSTIEFHMNGVVARAFTEAPAGRELYLSRISTLITNALDARALSKRIDGIGTALKPAFTRAEYRAWQKSAEELKAAIAARAPRMRLELDRMRTTPHPPR